MQYVLPIACIYYGNIWKSIIRLGAFFITNLDTLNYDTDVLFRVWFRGALDSAVLMVGLSLFQPKEFSDSMTDDLSKPCKQQSQYRKYLITITETSTTTLQTLFLETSSSTSCLASLGFRFLQILIITLVGEEKKTSQTDRDHTQISSSKEFYEKLGMDFYFVCSASFK